MKRLLATALVAAFLCPQAAFSVTEYRSGNYSAEGISLALEDPIGSVYRDGETVRFSIRTDFDAYAVVFNIDTEGFVHLLYPRDGRSLQKISSDRIYYLPEYEDEALVVSGKKGIEFVFALAAPHRDDFNRDEIAFLLDDERLPANRRFRIDGDPLLAANRIASQLIRGISHRNGTTLSFTYFYLNEAVDFPRYMCEDCYETGKDPYGPNMPVYVASADFERTNRLSFPLETGFVEDYGSVAVADYGDYTGGTTTTQVYVTYYPRWDDGFYSRSWYYADPWYWNWGWGGYWGSSWYFGVGWGWGWGGCHRYYFPYYYCSPYYPTPYRHYYAPGYGYPRRGLRPSPKGGSTGGGALYAGMTHGSDRSFRSTTRSAKPGVYTGKRTTFASAYRPGADKRSFKNGGTVRTTSKLIRTTGSENNGTRIYRGTKGKRVTTDRTRTRTSKQLARDQRVITRKNLGSERQRVFDSKNYKRTIDPRELKRGGRTSGSDPRGTRVKTRTNSGSKSTGSRAYKPNTRRGSSKSGSKTQYKAPSSRSSSRPSGTRSKRSGGSSRSSSSRGKGRK
jgi:hypothetical protein